MENQDLKGGGGNKRGFNTWNQALAILGYGICYIAAYSSITEPCRVVLANMRRRPHKKPLNVRSCLER